MLGGMRRQLAKVATGEASSDAIADTILPFNRFAEGVPATENMCMSILHFLKVLQNCYVNPDNPLASVYDGLSTITFADDSEYDTFGGLPVAIDEQFFFVVEFLPSGLMTHDWLMAEVWEKDSCLHNGHRTHRKLASSMHPPNAEGTRDLLLEVAGWAKDLLRRGLCPRCVPPALMRNAHAEFCTRCCIITAVAQKTFKL